MFRKSKSFTLIELLVVIFIIGVLAALITSNVSRSRMKGRDARRKADLNAIKAAVEEYAMEKGSLPGQDQSPQVCQYSAGGWCFSDGPWPSSLQTALQPYLYPLPKDPINARPTGHYYMYRYAENPAIASCNRPGTYKIDAELEVTTDPDLTNDGGVTSTRYELGTAADCNL